MSRELEQYLEEYMHHGKFPLTEEHKEFVRECVEGTMHIANFSEAGSGKSVCLEALKGYLGDKLLVGATTGIANSILFDNKGGDGTAHRIFSLPITMFNDKHEKRVSDYTSNLLAKSDLVEYIAIDEAGMLNPDHLELILSRISRFNKKLGHRKERFIKLILFGDLLQLLPVLSETDKKYLNKKYGSHYLFESRPFINGNFKKVNFSKVLRTNDKLLKEVLNVMRFGQEGRYSKAVEWMNKFYRPNNTPKNIPVITTTNKRVKDENDLAIKNNPNPSFFYSANTVGDFNWNDCPAEEHMELKKGLPIITLVNRDGYSNGSFGYIVECFDDSVLVEFPNTGQVLPVNLYEFEQRESFIVEGMNEKGEAIDQMESKVIGRAETFPIKIAAAFSIYRMQGRTLDVPAVLDLGWQGFDIDPENDWGVNFAYVGWSRFVKPEHVYLKNRMFDYKIDKWGNPKTHIKPYYKALDWLKEEDLI